MEVQGLKTEDIILAGTAVAAGIGAGLALNYFLSSPPNGTPGTYGCFPSKDYAKSVMVETGALGFTTFGFVKFVKSIKIDQGVSVEAAFRNYLIDWTVEELFGTMAISAGLSETQIMTCSTSTDPVSCITDTIVPIFVQEYSTLIQNIAANPDNPDNWLTYSEVIGGIGSTAPLGPCWTTTEQSR